jgi:hypothetical protein
VKPARRPKRSLFAELGEGMIALAQARQGKRKLRTHTVEKKLRRDTRKNLTTA